MLGGKDVDPRALIFVAGLVIEIILSLLVARYVWRRTGAPSVGRMSRVLGRATTIALLFSPTWVGCGAMAPLPFPVIVAMDLYFRGPACGQIHYFSTYNLLYVVAPTWIIATAVLAFRARSRPARAL